MATQGLVTVLQGQKVLMKVVVGSGGHLASKVAKALHEAWPCSAEEAYAIAQEHGFEDEYSLVVLTESETFHKLDEDLSESGRYRRTFEEPDFNPRRENGIAEYFVQVSV